LNDLSQHGVRLKHERLSQAIRFSSRHGCVTKRSAGRIPSIAKSEVPTPSRRGRCQSAPHMGSIVPRIQGSWTTADLAFRHFREPAAEISTPAERSYSARVAFCVPGNLSWPHVLFQKKLPTTAGETFGTMYRRDRGGAGSAVRTCNHRKNWASTRPEAEQACSARLDPL
jgi:hypothetical protein